MVTTIVKKENLSMYLRQADNFGEFVQVLGKDAAPYVQSVIIAASSTDDLMQCTVESIYRAALRAASLGLSCDPALKQAWLVPYNKNVAKKGEQPRWVKEAQFQPHYMGLYFLAMRTNKYRIINVAPIYDGQRVMENPLTGLHAVEETNGFLGQPQSYNSAYSRDVTVRRDQGKQVIGWIGYYKTTNGAEKSVYMSCIEIDEHAKRYVRDYDRNPNWTDAKKRPTMEMKTVLRALLNWADKSGIQHTDQLREALRADEPVEAEAEDVQAVIEGESIPVDLTKTEPVNQPENMNQDTGTEEKAIILIDPMGDWAVGFAAKEWNVDNRTAAQEIGKKKLGKRIDKQDFIQIVRGEVEAA